MTKAKQVEFPKTLQQAIIYFSDAENCVNFLSLVKGGGFPMLMLLSMRGDFTIGSP